MTRLKIFLVVILLPGILYAAGESSFYGGPLTPGAKLLAGNDKNEFFIVDRNQLSHTKIVMKGKRQKIVSKKTTSKMAIAFNQAIHHIHHKKIAKEVKKAAIKKSAMKKMATKKHRSLLSRKQLSKTNVALNGHRRNK